MYRELTLFRNELKNSIIPKYKIIGIVIELILSKEIFAKNSDIDSFLAEVFNISYKSYVIKSRTMIIARISRTIHDSEEDEYNRYRKKILNYINKRIEECKEKENKRDKNQFDGWLG